MVNNSKQQFTFLLTILAGTAVLTFFIFRPFLYALIIAVVFAIVLQPIYRRILNYVRGQRGLASLITMLVLAIFLFVPLTFLGILIFQEARGLYSSLAESGGQTEFFRAINNLVDNLRRFIPIPQEFSINFDQYIKQLIEWLIQNLGSIFSNLAKTLASSFIFLIALYYLLKDGSKLKRVIITTSPLTDIDDEVVLKKLEGAVNSVIKGNLAVALVQGTLVGLGFAIFGIPNPILWGSVAAIAVLIPSIGTALVMVPAILFLLLTNHLFSAVGLLIWGIIIVGLVDNFLNPKLVGRGMQIHPLIVLLSVLGGILFFGPIGFLLGPLTVGLFSALVEVYFSLMRKRK